MKWKKTHAILICSTLFMTACSTSVGVGTGFHLGGLGVGVSTSTPIKRKGKNNGGSGKRSIARNKESGKGSVKFL